MPHDEPLAQPRSKSTTSKRDTVIGERMVFEAPSRRRRARVRTHTAREAWRVPLHRGDVNTLDVRGAEARDEIAGLVPAPHAGAIELAPARLRPARERFV